MGVRNASNLEPGPLRSGLGLRHVSTAKPVRLMVHVALPVLLGGLIYVLWRSTDLLVFRWLAALGLDSIVASLRLLAAPFQEQLPTWVFYSLPDGLWAYAVTACMALIWAGYSCVSRVIWLSAGPLIGIGSELGQLVGMVPGTFEFADITLYAIGTCAALLLLRKEGV